MPAIVDFPTVVQDALAIFGEVFDTEAARRHFAEYLTGLDRGRKQDGQWHQP